MSFPLEPGQAVYVAPDGTVVPLAGPSVVAVAEDGQEQLITLPLDGA
jgi:hypothetical protein